MCAQPLRWRASKRYIYIFNVAHDTFTDSTVINAKIYETKVYIKCCYDFASVRFRRYVRSSFSFFFFSFYLNRNTHIILLPIRNKYKINVKKMSKQIFRFFLKRTFLLTKKNYSCYYISHSEQLIFMGNKKYSLDFAIVYFRIYFRRKWKKKMKNYDKIQFHIHTRKKRWWSQLGSHFSLIWAVRTFNTLLFTFIAKSADITRQYITMSSKGFNIKSDSSEIKWDCIKCVQNVGIFDTFAKFFFSHPWTL